MSDFHQAGIIATVHRLRERPLEELDREILSWSEETPTRIECETMAVESADNR